jgi:hypothetical protein
MGEGEETKIPGKKIIIGVITVAFILFLLYMIIKFAMSSQIG